MKPNWKSIGLVLLFLICILAQVSQASTIIYNFTDNVSNTAYWASPANPITVPSGGTQATAAQYTNMTTDNSAYALACSDYTNDDPYWNFNFTINETIADIKWINTSVNGKYVLTSGNEVATCYVYNYTSSAWITIAALTTSDTTISKNFTNRFSDIIDGSKHLVVYCTGLAFDSGECIYDDFVSVTVNNDTTPISPVMDIGDPLYCSIPSITGDTNTEILCMPKSNVTGQPLTGLSVVCQANAPPLYTGTIQPASACGERSYGVYNWTLLASNIAPATSYTINCSTLISTVANGFAASIYIMPNFAQPSDIINSTTVILGNMSANFTYINGQIALVIGNQTFMLGNETDIKNLIAYLNDNMSANFTYTNNLITYLNGNISSNFTYTNGLINEVLGNQTLILGNQILILGNESTIITNIEALNNNMNANFTYTNGQIALVLGNQTLILGNETVILTNLANVNATQNANYALLQGNLSLMNTTLNNLQTELLDVNSTQNANAAEILGNLSILNATANDILANLGNVNSTQNTNYAALQTLINSLSNLTAQQVWEYPLRDANCSNCTGGATAQEVWEYVSRTLTDYNLTEVIANLENINTTQNNNANLILGNQALILGNQSIIITNIADLNSNMSSNFAYIGGQINLVLGNQTFMLDNETLILTNIAYLNDNMSANFTNTNSLIGSYTLNITVNDTTNSYSTTNNNNYYTNYTYNNTLNNTVVYNTTCDASSVWNFPVRELTYYNCTVIGGSPPPSSPSSDPDTYYILNQTIIANNEVNGLQNWLSFQVILFIIAICFLGFGVWKHDTLTITIGGLVFIILGFIIYSEGIASTVGGTTQLQNYTYNEYAQLTNLTVNETIAYNTWKDNFTNVIAFFLMFFGAFAILYSVWAALQNRTQKEEEEKE